MIYSAERDTTMARRDPRVGHASARTCDQCQKRHPMGSDWKRGKVKAGPLKGLTGWICPKCKEQA